MHAAGSAGTTGRRYGTFARVAAALTALAITVVMTMAAASVWLFFTQPAVVAPAFGREGLTGVFRVVAAFVVSALGHALRYL